MRATRSIGIAGLGIAIVLLGLPGASATYSDGECWETGNGYGCQRAHQECPDGTYVFVYGDLIGWNMACVQTQQSM